MFIQCIDCGTKRAGAGFGVVEVFPSNKDTEPVQANVNMENVNVSCHETLQNMSRPLNSNQYLAQTKIKLLPEIFVCQNHVKDEKHVHQSIAHELIHAIDLCRTKMDPINNCIHMACTEIRAENLSGECNFLSELKNGQISNMKGHAQECVKRRAGLSVSANKNCIERSGEYVEAAFERCYKDTFPFDRHPNLR